MKALILLDLQNDYGQLGAMPVPESEAIIPLANQLMEQFDLVAATQDWHPADHITFAANHPWRHPNQIKEINGQKHELSIIHCVQNSFGAELMGNLNTNKIDAFFLKGSDANIASYSGFYDARKSKNTGLEEWFKKKGVTEVYILGLTIEGSVKATALDATNMGFKTTIIENASRGRDDTAIIEAKKEMLQHHIEIINLT